jgi:restriction-modification enzyme MmeI-like protein
VKGAGVLDYVTCWYLQAARYISGTHMSVAFVSTNSIAQGEQVGILWGELFQRWRLKIHFAHRTFAWASESRGRAHVHVVIIGFGGFDRVEKRIFDYETLDADPTEIPAANISPYLVEGNDLVIMKRTRPLCAGPELVFGSMPNDGGHLMLTDTERAALLRDEPEAEPYVRHLIGSEEFINGISRWCLWLKDIPPAVLRRLPIVMQRVEGVRQHRSSSTRPTTKKLAATPTLFGEDRQPSHRYLVVPGVSSENRHYIPIAFSEPEIIANNLVYCAEGADVWAFGVLTSEMHMAWVRLVAGRLESRYRYSAGLVYNNFPWPNATQEQRERVEEKARALLEARAPHLPPRGLATLADLYDPLTMPATLTRAHAELDRAVERCYRPEPFRSDRERVEHLFRLYEHLITPLLPVTASHRSTGRQAARSTSTHRRTRTPGLPAQDS